MPWQGPPRICTASKQLLFFSWCRVWLHFLHVFFLCLEEHKPYLIIHAPCKRSCRAAGTTPQLFTPEAGLVVSWCNYSTGARITNMCVLQYMCLCVRVKRVCVCVKELLSTMVPLQQSVCASSCVCVCCVGHEIGLCVQIGKLWLTLGDSQASRAFTSDKLWAPFLFQFSSLFLWGP